MKTAYKSASSSIPILMDGAETLSNRMWNIGLPGALEERKDHSEKHIGDKHQSIKEHCLRLDQAQSEGWD